MAGKVGQGWARSGRAGVAWQGGVWHGAVSHGTSWQVFLLNRRK